MLSGNAPFQGRTDIEILDKIKKGKFQFLRIVYF